MFTIEQIKAAHSKTKTGADFPRYIKDIAELGVTSYENFVMDGNTIYYGKDNYSIQSGAKYPSLEIANTSNKSQFAIDLKSHQLGQSDFPTFCKQSAAAGIEKWISNLSKMTCAYYDKAGKELLVERIPSL